MNVSYYPYADQAFLLSIVSSRLPLKLAKKDINAVEDAIIQAGETKSD